MSKFLAKLISENIETSLVLSEDSTVILGDIGKLEQVIMNLVINARDAMPDGGRIEIETERLTGQGDAHSGHGGRRADMIRLSVRDCGIGMDEATRARLFEPFFTTKGREHGTGLGLPVVYGIVQSHEGRIEVDSELGTESVFNVFFPSAPTEAREEDSGLEPPGTGTIPVHARVLLVEDDQAIRAMVEQALIRSGLRVVTAGTVEEAETLVRQEAEFDLVLTDIVLPDGSGATLPDRLNIDVPYIFASGYLEDTADLERVHASGFSFLQKPYDINGLISTINDALQRNQR